MTFFTKGKMYRFTCSDACTEFYRNLKCAWEQQGLNCYYPQKAVVMFLGGEEIGGETFNKWLHGNQVVYINFCDTNFFEEMGEA